MLTRKSATRAERVDGRIEDHIARPGPAYWDNRCLTCSGDVRAHVPAAVQLLRRALRTFRSSSRG